jgi:hypothetical protein
LNLRALLFLLFLESCGAGYGRAASLDSVSIDCFGDACGTLDFNCLHIATADAEGSNPREANEPSRETEFPSIEKLGSDFQEAADKLAFFDNEQPVPGGSTGSNDALGDDIFPGTAADGEHESERDRTKKLGLAAPEPGDLVLVFTGLVLVLIGRTTRRQRR